MLGADGLILLQLLTYGVLLKHGHSFNNVNNDCRCPGQLDLRRLSLIRPIVFLAKRWLIVGLQAILRSLRQTYA